MSAVEECVDPRALANGPAVPGVAPRDRRETPRGSSAVQYYASPNLLRAPLLHNVADPWRCVCEEGDPTEREEEEEVEEGEEEAA